MADMQAPILADHDGFVEAFYHLLWAKNFNGEPCPEILVPDTIIYKFRIPAYWYAPLSLSPLHPGVPVSTTHVSSSLTRTRHASLTQVLYRRAGPAASQEQGVHR